MFESVKHWLQSLEQGSHWFEHADDAVLHVALASVLYHAVSENPKLASREKHHFADILHRECELDAATIDHLWEVASASTSDYHGDLHIVHEHLKDNPAVRMDFLKKLLEVVDIHGVQEGELELFHEAVHELFPEIKEIL